MKVLFIVHVESMFKKFFPDPYDFGQDFIDEVDSNDYDLVISLCSGVEDLEPIPEVFRISDEIWDWSWGYYPNEDMFSDSDDEKWIIQSSGHEWTWVPDEIRNGRFKNADIFISGGCDSECLEDWRCVLDSLNLAYKELTHLIY